MSTPDAATCSDREWCNATGMCGCGMPSETCHPGRGCGQITDDGWLGHTVCSRCPSRHEQGFHDLGLCECDTPPTPCCRPRIYKGSDHWWWWIARDTYWTHDPAGPFLTWAEALDAARRHLEGQ